jgi:hypothetical protein
MQSETSSLLGDLSQHKQRVEISGGRLGHGNLHQTTTKAKVVISMLAMVALVVVLSAHSPSSRSSPSVIDEHNTALDWDEFHHSWEAALYENGKNEVAALDAFDAFSKIEDSEEGTLNKLLYLNHTYAFDMLKKSDDEESSALDFYYYQQGWEAQINQAYCAVASSAAILNSLRGKITLPQDAIYIPYPWATQNQLMLNDCVRQNVYDLDIWQHVFFGLTLDLARQLLDCHLADQGYTVEAYTVVPQKTTKEEVREAIKGALMDAEARVMVNYDRGGIGQGDMGHGHFCPIGAYNQEMDAFLVMDVAKYKYPPVWVPTSKLVAGMGSSDNCVNLSYPDSPLDFSKSPIELAEEIGCKSGYRGFIVVKPTI